MTSDFYEKAGNHLINGVSVENLAQTAKELAYDAIFENLPISFYWMDKEGVLLGCNQEVLNALNLTSLDNFIGRHTSEIVTKEAWANCEKVLETAENLTIEEVHIQDNGEKITFLSIKSPILDKKNKVQGLIGVAINITERKKMEQELLAAKLLAEAANQAKSEFLLNMSHDIRTPLNGIIGFTQIMQLKEVDPHKKEELDIIFTSGVKLSSLLNEIVDASNLEFNGQAIQQIPLNLKIILNNINDLFLAEIKQKKLTFSTFIDDSIPKDLSGDSIRIHRILLNLIGNALKFTHQGNISLNINLKSKIGNTVILEFITKDTGIGIPKDKLAIIFERFQRLTLANNSVYQGSGLGLYIVKKFLSDLNGQIEVDSIEGEGTTFKCYIPVILNSV